MKTELYYRNEDESKTSETLLKKEKKIETNCISYLKLEKRSRFGMAGYNSA